MRPFGRFAMTGPRILAIHVPEPGARGSRPRLTVYAIVAAGAASPGGTFESLA